MKRSLIIAGAFAAALAPALAPAPAAAQFTDALALAQRTLHQGQTLLQWKQQIEDMATRIRQARVQYEALTGIRTLEGAGRVLMSEVNRSPMAPSSQMVDLLYGTARAANVNRFLERNRVYESQEEDYQARELRRRAIAIANLQAEVQAGIEAAEERMTGLLELLGIVEKQPDLPAAQTLGNRLASEGRLLENEEGKVRRLAVMLQQQERVDRQRDQEESRRQADSYYERTVGAWDVQWDR